MSSFGCEDGRTHRPWTHHHWECPGPVQCRLGRLSRRTKSLGVANVGLVPLPIPRSGSQGRASPCRPQACLDPLGNKYSLSSLIDLNLEQSVDSLISSDPVFSQNEGLQLVLAQLVPSLHRTSCVEAAAPKQPRPWRGWKSGATSADVRRVR